MLVVTPDKFTAPAKAIGRPDLITDPHFSDTAKQAANAAQLRAILDDAFAKEPIQHWGEDRPERFGESRTLSCSTGAGGRDRCAPTRL